MLFHLWTDGDPSVGIGGSDAVVDISDVDDVSDAKRALEDAFSKIWHEKPHVATQEELDRGAEETLFFGG